MKITGFNFALLGLLLVLAGSAQASTDQNEQSQAAKIEKPAKTKAADKRVVRGAGLQSDGELVQAQRAPKPMPHESAKKGVGKQPVMPIGQHAISVGATGGATTQGATTGVGDCSGVDSCNDFIAACLGLGGNVTPTSYDRDTGAPSSATCFPPGT